MKKILSKQISFRPKARIMKTLGDELISSETVAIIELVKNAYDADAKNVLIKFGGSLRKGEGYIEISDDGHGMNMTVVQNGWMEPATDFKKKIQRSPKFKRRILGEKGVGRFATSRLATELELITKPANSIEEIYVLFDWSQFDDTNKYLDQIEVLIESRAARIIKDHGTTLRMNHLRKDWSKDDFTELQRGLARLVSPFNKEADMTIKIQLPDLFSEFNHEIRPPSIIRHPHYLVKGKVDKEGFFDVDMQFRVRGSNEKASGAFAWVQNGDSKSFFALSKEKYQELNSEKKTPRSFSKICTGAFNFELRIWDRDELEGVIQHTKSTLQDVRRDLDAVAGINIYRDNFRVLPYGEPTDDWLQLNLRRVQQPTKKLSNNQILGYINITADGNPLLVDQSNREGLNENQALNDLRNIMMHILNEFEILRYQLRPRKKSENRSYSLAGLFTAINLTPLRERLEREYPKDGKTIKIVGEFERKLEEQIDEIQVVISRYQRLATLGTLIDVVLHDGRHPLSKIINEAFLGKEEVNKTERKDNVLMQLKKRFTSIESQADHMANVFRRIEPFAGRRRGKPSKFYLEDVIKESIEVLESAIRKYRISITVAKTRTLVRLDSSEIQQVIINLLDNSIYWLQLEKETKREIFIEVIRISEERVDIIFSDSGIGIPDKNKEKIFEPYFSTKPNGVGLGLSIAGEIVNDYYDGKLELMSKGPLKGATFRIILKNRV